MFSRLLAIKEPPIPLYSQLLQSDMYSLGIVLLELLMLMKTRMERSKIIGALQAGQIPDSLKANHPKWVSCRFNKTILLTFH